MMDNVTLDGVVEADETFTDVSYKGNHLPVSLSNEVVRRINGA